MYSGLGPLPCCALSLLRSSGPLSNIDMSPNLQSHSLGIGHVFAASFQIFHDVYPDWDLSMITRNPRNFYYCFVVEMWKSDRASGLTLSPALYTVCSLLTVNVEQMKIQEQTRQSLWDLNSHLRTRASAFFRSHARQQADISDVLLSVERETHLQWNWLGPNWPGVQAALHSLEELLPIVLPTSYSRRYLMGFWCLKTSRATFKWSQTDDSLLWWLIFSVNLN